MRTRVTDSRASLEAQPATSWRGAWGLAEGTPMTRDHARKQAIRARMAATGEPYSVAARALDAEAPVPPARFRRASPLCRICYRRGRWAGRKRSRRTRRRSGSAADPQPVADPAGAWPRSSPARAGRWGRRAPESRAGADTDLGRIPERIPSPPPPGLVGRLAGAGRPCDPEPRRARNMDAAELREQFLHQFGAGFLEPSRRPVPDRLGRLGAGASRRQALRRPVRGAAEPPVREPPVAPCAATRWTRSGACKARPRPAGSARETRALDALPGGRDHGGRGRVHGLDR